MDRDRALLTPSDPMHPTRLRPSLTILASLLATLLAGASEAAAQHSARIVGGTTATYAWPAQGHLRAGAEACGGTLVSGRWFLTAGHCVGDATTLLDKSEFQITLGRPDRSGPAVTPHLVDQVIRHASYRESLGSEDSEYDLALLRIASPVAPAQEPLRIVGANEPQLWAPGTRAVVIGWGTTCEIGCGQSLQLREAAVPIVGDAACAAAYGAVFSAATMVCAGNGVSDTCQGDSGGPLMVVRGGESVLAGITSWGFGCADPRYPGVYTRVGDPVLNAWIRARIPTASIASVSPAAPLASEAVTLTAGGTTPAGQAAPATSWDLNDDGVYGDAAGPTAVLARPAGAYGVRVQQLYPDGDRAVAREVIAVAAVPPPPPPAPPPPAVAAKPLARLVDVPRRVRVKSLLDGRQPVRVSCSAACSISGTLRLSGPTARRIGLTSRSASVQIGSARARFDRAKSALVTIRLTRRAVSHLRKARSGTLALRMTVTRGSRRQQLNELIGLRR